MLSRVIAGLRARLSPDSAPRRLREWVVDLLKADHSELRAFELSDYYVEKVMSYLSAERTRALELGQESWFEFNSVSPEFIQGTLFIEPGDPQSVRIAKKGRLLVEQYKESLASLDFDAFEVVCAAVLSLLGARHYRRTKRSKDQGIDFYGQLLLGDLGQDEFPFVRFQDDLSIWLVGQAKHYPNRKVSTPEVRNLVGSLNLARFKEYASTTDLMHDLPVRSCDPVFVLFLTTGTFSRDATTLGSNAGVILKDIESLARLLADSQVGLNEDGLPTEESVARWASSLENPRAEEH